MTKDQIVSSNSKRLKPTFLLRSGANIIHVLTKGLKF